MFDVLIVGYGPAGVTAAHLLGQRGYRVAVIEQSLTVYDKPRAITADQEAMRVFQECGLAADIATTTTPHPGTDFVGVEGEVIKRFYPQPPPHQLAWEPAWMFVQPELEATLRHGVDRFAQVEVFLGHECVDVSQTQDQVDIKVRRLSDGEVIGFQARYVIGSDGGRSLLRRHFQADIEDLAFDEWWIVVDAWLQREVDLPPRCVQYCRPSRPGTYIVGPGQLRRWEIKMLPGETPDDFQDESAVRKVLASFVDVDALDLCRIAIYRFHALVVKQWQFDRVFLMGDAAHQMPPFLGQGLCAAIRDAVNLVWKLDAVLRLKCTPGLLSTYGAERTPHVRTIVAHAKSFGLIIGELDETEARARDAHLLAELAAGKAETVRQKFIPGLECGLIDLDEHARPRAAAGTLFVQPWVKAAAGEDQRLDDVTGTGFLMATHVPEAMHWLDAESQALWARLQGRQVLIQTRQDSPVPGQVSSVLVERDRIFADWMSSLDTQVVLVRPDHYVYGSASHPGELKRLIRQLHDAMFGVT